MVKKVLHPNHTAVPECFQRLPNGYGVVKIGVSGSADTRYSGLDAFEKGKEIGREIARQGAITVTGATTGFPMYAAMGAKDERGFSIGLSPAATEREHVETYKLPLDYMDVIIYTGFGYSGRDLLFVRSADAMIIGPGRVGTINEFAVAFEDHRPIGILRASSDTDELLELIIDAAHRPNPNIVFDTDPKALVETYKLPLDYMDVIIYTGFGYSGRDLLFVRSADAMIIGPGRVGTINEFAVAFEDHRPIGILRASSDTDELLELIIDAAHRPNPNIVFDTDPKALVERLIEMAHKIREDDMLVYNNHDGWSGTGKNADVIL